MTYANRVPPGYIDAESLRGFRQRLRWHRFRHGGMWPTRRLQVWLGAEAKEL